MYSRKKNLAYHLMMLPGTLLLLVFSVMPLSGIAIAFEQYYPAKGILHSKWVGLYNFKYMFMLPDSAQIFANTLIISISKIVVQLVVPVIVALMLNEIKSSGYRRTIQTIVYLPHFMSWVILGGVIGNLLSLDGLVNQIIQAFGGSPIVFLASNRWFRPLIILTDCWKEFGFGTIIYLAALTSIDTALYEAAYVDGANRRQVLRYITLPCILPTIALMLTLSLGNVLNAGFEQIFNLYNPLVYETGDIIDTYVHRVGLVNAQYGLATAVGLLKSLAGFIMITLSYKIADLALDYKIL